MANKYTHSGSSISQADWDYALELAERWQDVRTDKSYGAPGKNLGAIARAFLHLKVCYDEMVKLHADCDTASVPEEGTLLYAERYRKLRIAADREWVDWHDGAERHHAGCGEELDRMLDMNNGEASK